MNIETLVDLANMPSFPFENTSEELLIVLRTMNDVFVNQRSIGNLDVAIRFTVREALFTASRQPLPEEDVVFVASLCVSLAPVHVSAWYEEETHFHGRNHKASKLAVLDAIEKAFTQSTSPDH